MAAVPKLRRISIEDLSSLDSEVRKGISKLLVVLNPFLSSVTSALDNKLTFVENSACVIKELKFTMPETGAALILDGYGTSNFSGREPKLRRKGNEVRITGLLNHRSTNLTGFTTPIFKIPKGYRPVRPLLSGVTYFNQPAALDINFPNIDLAYLSYAASSTPSSFISLDDVRFDTADDLPEFPAPFPLQIDVSSLTTKPTICEVMKIEDTTSKTKLSIKPDLVWTVENVQGKNTLKIKRADGLIDGHSYSMTVLCTS